MTALAKVLLVDDEREFAVVLARRLAKRNFSVKLAHSGEDALAQLAADRDIEVVLLDAKMPGIDGIETLNKFIGEVKIEDDMTSVVIKMGN
jgi:CheY-like chemotaxis protein